MPPLPDATRIGAVHLVVADLARSLGYYRDAIGLQRLDAAADGADRGVPLGIGGEPLVVLHPRPGAAPVGRAAGLFHLALRLPTRRDLAAAIDRLARQGTRIDGAADHLVSEAIYLTDPDGHGIEIYRDRPREAWPVEGGRLRMDSLPLDLDGILAELGRPGPEARAAASPPAGAPATLPLGTDLGHVHLRVADLDASEAFYLDRLGFERQARMPGASFVSAGGYHHHVGLNTWAGRGIPPAPESAARLLAWTLRLPDAGSLEALLAGLRSAGLTPAPSGPAWAITDPSGIRLLLTAAGGAPARPEAFEPGGRST
ncbi:MAG: VOC family protein [Caldilineae bacterium]|nr:VOC family protein [Caldilineae bacterium]